jgi:imidazoleglycerol phosphate synthase glutamine amidotransferase subunit HisH
VLVKIIKQLLWNFDADLRHALVLAEEYFHTSYIIPNSLAVLSNTQYSTDVVSLVCGNSQQLIQFDPGAASTEIKCNRGKWVFYYFSEYSLL